jgi:hypothetical protein
MAFTQQEAPEVGRIFVLREGEGFPVVDGYEERLRKD